MRFIGPCERCCRHPGRRDRVVVGRFQEDRGASVPQRPLMLSIQANGGHLHDGHAAAAPVEKLLTDAFEDGKRKRSWTALKLETRGGACADGCVSHGVGSSFVWRFCGSSGALAIILAFQNSRRRRARSCSVPRERSSGNDPTHPVFLGQECGVS